MGQKDLEDELAGRTKYAAEKKGRTEEWKEEQAVVLAFTKHQAFSVILLLLRSSSHISWGLPEKLYGASEKSI